jgi:hypothetical protein
VLARSCGDAPVSNGSRHADASPARTPTTRSSVRAEHVAELLERDRLVFVHIAATIASSSPSFSV